MRIAGEDKRTQGEWMLMKTLHHLDKYCVAPLVCVPLLGTLVLILCQSPLHSYTGLQSPTMSSGFNSRNIITHGLNSLAQWMGLILGLAWSLYWLGDSDIYLSK